MTQKVYDHLKALLVQGCNSERFELINCAMTTRQRAEFAMSLTLSPSDHNVQRTWAMIAIALAGDVLDLLSQQKEAVNGELTAPEYRIMNGVSLQEAR